MAVRTRQSTGEDTNDPILLFDLQGLSASSGYSRKHDLGIANGHSPRKGLQYQELGVAVLWIKNVHSHSIPAVGELAALEHSGLYALESGSRKVLQCASAIPTLDAMLPYSPREVYSIPLRKRCNRSGKKDQSHSFACLIPCVQAKSS